MTVELRIPSVGESITEVEIGEWRKGAGDAVQKDETIAILETDKATVELPAPSAGTLARIVKEKGQTAAIGEVIGYLEEDGKAAAPPALAKKQTPAGAPESEPRVMPAAERLLAEHGLQPGQIKATGPGGRILKEDLLRHIESGAKPEPAPAVPAAKASPQKTAPAPEQPKEKPGPGTKLPGERQEEVVPMSRLRRTLAERLVHSQHTAAMLTTFNEIDMTEVMTLRKQHAEAFQAKYNVKLGFMSFFVKASVEALKAVPQVNAEIRGTDIAYRNYYDIGIAIGGGRGLVVPVLRNAERMSFAEIEIAIGDFARRARENKLTIAELQGGTFTISNGGVYGSLLSTPILNPPQSGILGMHTIQDRPVAREGSVVIRPMMYVALSYDHRIVDGREAVTFLKRIKDAIEAPARILMEI